MRIFILLSVFAVALSRECGENQHYKSCGTACPLTCENYKNPPKACILMCNPGCHCDEGFVKAKDGSCVRPEQCPSEGATSEICSLPSERGLCRGYFPRYYYDKDTEKCKMFSYGGCGGNENNFETKEECESQCAVCGENERYYVCGTACPLTCSDYGKPPKICKLLCVPGCSCEKGFVRSDTGRCVRPEDCSNEAQATSEICSLPSERGLCRGYMPRYYYNKDTGKCQRFIYGGCGGNENNFESEEECESQCGSS